MDLPKLNIFAPKPPQAAPAPKQEAAPQVKLEAPKDTVSFGKK